MPSSNTPIPESELEKRIEALEYVTSSPQSFEKHLEVLDGDLMLCMRLEALGCELIPTEEMYQTTHHENENSTVKNDVTLKGEEACSTPSEEDLEKRLAALTPSEEDLAKRLAALDEDFALYMRIENLCGEITPAEEMYQKVHENMESTVKKDVYLKEEAELYQLTQRLSTIHRFYKPSSSTKKKVLEDIKKEVQQAHLKYETGIEKNPTVVMNQLTFAIQNIRNKVVTDHQSNNAFFTRRRFGFNSRLATCIDKAMRP